MRVAPGDPSHGARLAAEEAFWENPPITAEVFEAMQRGAYLRFLNRAYTGDPEKSWLDDLISRGPFERAAALGGTQGTYESLWLRRNASRTLEVYDVSAKVLARARSQISTGVLGSPDPRARFFRADLNFVELPVDTYDVVWSSGCIHHLVNLEYLFEEVERALQSHGLFAVFDYIGEPRSQYGAERLKLMNSIFERMPRSFRLADRVELPQEAELSPFEGVRANETLGLLCKRFDVVHLAQVGALYPMGLLINFPKIEAEAPSLLAELFAADESARADESLQKCAMYGVFRKRS